MLGGQICYPCPKCSSTDTHVIYEPRKQTLVRGTALRVVSLLICRTCSKRTKVVVLGTKILTDATWGDEARCTYVICLQCGKEVKNPTNTCPDCGVKCIPCGGGIIVDRWAFPLVIPYCLSCGRELPCSKIVDKDGHQYYDLAEKPRREWELSYYEKQSDLKDYEALMKEDAYGITTNPRLRVKSIVPRIYYLGCILRGWQTVPKTLLRDILKWERRKGFIGAEEYAGESKALGGRGIKKAARELEVAPQKPKKKLRRRITPTFSELFATVVREKVKGGVS